MEIPLPSVWLDKYLTIWLSQAMLAGWQDCSPVRT